jgi:NhaP-type Na+/H+ and K+/H+ antiporter
MEFRVFMIDMLLLLVYILLGVASAARFGQFALSRTLFASVESNPRYAIVRYQSNFARLMLVSSNLAIDLNGAVSFVLRNGKILEDAHYTPVQNGDMVVVAVSRAEEAYSDYLSKLVEEFCATGIYTGESNEDVDFLFIPIEHE